MEQLQTYNVNDLNSIASALKASAGFYIQDGDYIGKVIPFCPDNTWSEKECQEIDAILNETEKHYEQGLFISKEDFQNSRRKRIEELKGQAL